MKKTRKNYCAAKYVCNLKILSFNEALYYSAISRDWDSKNKKVVSVSSKTGSSNGVIKRNFFRFSD